jgi:hypothetical protein
MEIPLPDKPKKDDKKQNASPAPKGEDKPIKTHIIGFEELESKLPAMVKEINDFYYGDIEYPTEFDKFIPEKINDKNIDEYILAQTAWIAKTSAFIALHLQRWIGEKVIDEIERIYKNMSNPFTQRVMTIIPDCERMLNELPSTMPAFQQRFKEKYEQLRSVAKKVDEKQIRTDGDINGFKISAKLFYDTVMTIYSDAYMVIQKLTQPAKEQKKKGVIWKILKIIVKIIGAIVIGIIVAVVIDIFGDFGWIGKIKIIIYNIFTSK